MHALRTIAANELKRAPTRIHRLMKRLNYMNESGKNRSYREQVDRMREQIN